MEALPVAEVVAKVGVGSLSVVPKKTVIAPGSVPARLVVAMAKGGGSSTDFVRTINCPVLGTLCTRCHDAHKRITIYLFIKSSGGWVKIELTLPQFHVYDTCRVSI